MLKTRVITGSILGALLLLGIFLLPRVWVVLAFGLVFTIAAWEWAGFGALRGLAGRCLYAAAMALILWGCWVWSGDSQHLLTVLWVACAWWVLALLWLTLAAGLEPSPP